MSLEIQFLLLLPHFFFHFFTIILLISVFRFFALSTKKYKEGKKNKTKRNCFTDLYQGLAVLIFEILVLLIGPAQKNVNNSVCILKSQRVQIFRSMLSKPFKESLKKVVHTLNFTIFSIIQVILPLWGVPEKFQQSQQMFGICSSFFIIGRQINRTLVLSFDFHFLKYTVKTNNIFFFRQLHSRKF